MAKKIRDIIVKQEKIGGQGTMEQPASIEKPAEFEAAEQIGLETQPEAVKTPGIEAIKEVPAAQPSPTLPSAPALPAKDQFLEKIEDVLAEDLEEVYFQLSPDKQAEFKKTGEETASKIEILLKEAKIKIKKILELIMDWLKIIPGVNKFFLEQEAKIKTDKILEIKEEKIFPSEDKNKI